MTIEELYINMVMFYNWTWSEFCQLELREVSALARAYLKRKERKNENQ